MLRAIEEFAGYAPRRWPRPSPKPEANRVLNRLRPRTSSGL